MRLTRQDHHKKCLKETFEVNETKEGKYTWLVPRDRVREILINDRCIENIDVNYFFCVYQQSNGRNGYVRKPTEKLDKPSAQYDHYQLKNANPFVCVIFHLNSQVATDIGIREIYARAKLFIVYGASPDAEACLSQFDKWVGRFLKTFTSSYSVTTEQFNTYSKDPLLLMMIDKDWDNSDRLLKLLAQDVDLSYLDKLFYLQRISEQTQESFDNLSPQFIKFKQKVGITNEDIALASHLPAYYEDVKNKLQEAEIDLIDNIDPDDAVIQLLNRKHEQNRRT